MEQNKKNKKAVPKIPILIISTALCAILVFLIWRLISDSVNISCEAALSSYTDSFNESKESVYNDFYFYAYNNAEEKYHVSNDVKINIDSILEVSKLQVYEAYDTEYVINKMEDNDYESWYEINGKCVYYVDLSQSEILVDQVRKAVTVRIPRPEKEFKVETPENLLFADKTIKLGVLEFNNGSSRIGETDAHNAEVKGYELIVEYFMTNGTLDSKAEDAAVRMITSLVNEANIGVDGLIVDVEFTDK